MSISERDSCWLTDRCMSQLWMPLQIESLRLQTSYNVTCQGEREESISRRCQSSPINQLPSQAGHPELTEMGEIEGPINEKVPIPSAIVWIFNNGSVSPRCSIKYLWHYVRPTGNIDVEEASLNRGWRKQQRRSGTFLPELNPSILSFKLRDPGRNYTSSSLLQSFTAINWTWSVYVVYDRPPVCSPPHYPPPLPVLPKVAQDRLSDTVPLHLQYPAGETMLHQPGSKR